MEEKKIPFLHRLEFFGYQFVEKLVCSIPDDALPGVARFFAFLTYYLLRIRRKVTLNNLQLAFPEKNSHWRSITAYFSYLHFSLMILEFMKMQKWGVNRLKQKIPILKIEDILQAYQERRGGVLVSGHFGNWEMAMGYLFSQGVESIVIQQRQNNSLIDKRMKELRQKWGMKIIYPRGAVQQAERIIKKGKIVGLLGDQDAGNRGVFVPFFGQPSSTHFGAAVMSLKSHAPLFVGICPRLNCQTFQFIVKKITLPDFFNLTDEMVQKVTAEIQKHLEQAIRKYPEQYFWMHRRWKTPPP
jgi:KDO2-lipid IV(A) lauroyltransferase